jgi:hypothetical protein
VELLWVPVLVLQQEENEPLRLAQQQVRAVISLHATTSQTPELLER